MTDYLKNFTPEELELIKAQNGKFTLESNNIANFEDDSLPQELLDKIMCTSIVYFQEQVMEGGEKLHDVFFEPNKVARQFLRLFGLTVEKASLIKKAPRVSFDENNAQLLITQKRLQNALSPIKNDVAYVARSNQLKYEFDENGNYKDTVIAEDSFDEITNNTTTPADYVDTDLLMTLASAVKASFIKNCGFLITVYLPNFAKAMSRQFETTTTDKKHNLYDFKSDLDKLESIIGVLVEQKKIQSAFKIIDIDQQRKELTFASPYLYSLMEMLQDNRITSVTKHNNIPDYDIEAVSYLISSKINKARNKMTSQVICYIVARVHQRGSDTDAELHPKKRFDDKKQVTTKISYKDIIKYSPRLEEALRMSSPQTKRQNQILNRTILGKEFNKPIKAKKGENKTDIKIKETTIVEDYLKTYTDIFNYWKDVTITVEPVNMKTLDNCIVITHHGINGDCVPRFTLPHIVEDLFGNT